MKFHDRVAYKFAEPSLEGSQRHAGEQRVYERLGAHPRILPCLGKDTATGALRFKYMKNGSVLMFLSEHPNTSLGTRLRWIAEIAEGIAYLHSKGVVWVDCTLHNVLADDYGDVVLCDFAGSCIDSNFSDISPPLYCVLASVFDRNTSIYPPEQDRFAFATCMFILLMHRLPHRRAPLPSEYFLSRDDQLQILSRHRHGDFEAVSQEAYPGLADVIQKCWRNEYSNSDEMFDEVMSGIVSISHVVRNATSVEMARFYPSPDQVLAASFALPTFLVPTIFGMSLAAVVVLVAWNWCRKGPEQILGIAAHGTLEGRVLCCRDSGMLDAAPQSTNVRK